MSEKKEEKVAEELFRILIPSSKIEEFIRKPEILLDKLPIEKEEEKRTILNTIADALSQMEKKEDVIVRIFKNGDIKVKPEKVENSDIQLLVPKEEKKIEKTPEKVESKEEPSKDERKKEREQEEKKGGGETETRMITIKIRDPFTDKVKELKLKPGTYYIGKDPELLDGRIYLWSKDRKVHELLIESLDTGMVSKEHIKLVVRENGKIFIQDHGFMGTGSTYGTYILGEDGSVKKKLGKLKTYELKPGEGVILGATIRNGKFEPSGAVFYLEEVNGNKVEIPEVAKKRIKEEAEEVAVIGKVVKTPPKRDKISEIKKASERIAGEAINTVRVNLVKHSEETGTPVPTVTESGFTALFDFIWNYKDVLSEGTLDEIRQKIVNDKNLFDEFYDTVKKMLESVEVYKEGKWTKREITDEYIEELTKQLIKSDVFIYRLKTHAESMKRIDEKNPDTISVMNNYAEVIRTVGMITPALTMEHTRSMKVYMSRLKGLLTGELKPKTEFEKVIVNQYKFSQGDISLFERELSMMKKDEKKAGREIGVGH